MSPNSPRPERNPAKTSGELEISATRNTGLPVVSSAASPFGGPLADRQPQFGRPATAKYRHADVLSDVIGQGVAQVVQACDRFTGDTDQNVTDHHPRLARRPAGGDGCDEQPKVLPARGLARCLWQRHRLRAYPKKSTRYVALVQQGIDHSRNGRSGNDDAVTSRQGRRSDANHRSLRVRRRPPGKALVDAPVQADESVDMAAEPRLPWPASSVDEPVAGGKLTV